MAEFSIRFDGSDVYAYLSDVPGAAKRATARAINAMTSDIRSTAESGILDVYKVRPVDARRAVKMVSRAGPARLRAMWAARGGPVPLKAYGAQLVGAGRRRRGRPGNSPVIVEVIPGRRRIVQGAFFGPNGHVYRRIGPKRLPIKKLHGPGIPKAFVKSAVTGALVSVSARKLPARIDSEMVRELRKIETGHLPKK